jgi:hypothetical protein
MFTFHISQALLLYKSCTIIIQEGQVKEWMQRLPPVGCIIVTALGWMHSTTTLVNSSSIKYLWIRLSSLPSTIYSGGVPNMIHPRDFP